jgi:hypothetical protein
MIAAAGDPPMTRSFQETAYPVQVWAAMALSAILFMVASTYLWLQASPTAQRRQQDASDQAAVQSGSDIATAQIPITVGAK